MISASEKKLKKNSQHIRLNELTVLIVVLPVGLWSAQPRALLRVFWVNYGRVSSLQVLSDAGRTSLVVLQLPLGEEALQLCSGINTLNCTQEVCVGGGKNKLQMDPLVYVACHWKSPSWTLGKQLL